MIAFDDLLFILNKIIETICLLIPLFQQRKKNNPASSI